MEACCQASISCPMCREDHTILNSNGEQCSKEAICCKCGGKHSATYKGNPMYAERHEIIQIKVERKISYPETVKVVHREPVSKEGEVIDGLSQC